MQQYNTWFSDLISVPVLILQYSPFVLAVGQYFAELPIDFFLILSALLVSDIPYTTSFIVRVLAIISHISTATVGIAGLGVMAVGGVLILSVGNA